MSIIFLKVKFKSLAAEAIIIRREERKLYDRRPRSLWDRLNFHRRYDVRREARAAALAYGFLRGRAYHSIEGKTYCAPDKARVVALVKKYGPSGAHTQVEAWFAAKIAVASDDVRRAA